MNKSKVVLAVCVVGISFLAAMNSDIRLPAKLKS